MGGAWTNFVFWVFFWRVLIGVRCQSSLLFSDVLVRTWLKLGAWVELGPTKIFWVIFWQVFLKGVRCTSFFDFFGCTRLHAAQTRWVEGAWANFVFWSNFLASFYDRSSLHEFLYFIGRTSSHTVQTRWVGGARANEDLWSYFWRVFMIGLNFRSYVAQTRGWVNLDLWSYFLASSYGRSSWTSFFFGGGSSCCDCSYLGEFLCPEVLGIATKFRFRESRVIAKPGNLESRAIA